MEKVLIVASMMSKHACQSQIKIPNCPKGLGIFKVQKIHQLSQRDGFTQSSQATRYSEQIKVRS